MNSTYRLVFDVAQDPLPQNWTFAAGGLLFVILGGLMVFWPALIDRLLPGGIKGRARRIFAWVFFLFAVIWTAVSTLHTLRMDQILRGASNHNTCTSVEGIVTDYVPMPYGGHSNESFSVNGVKFAYSDFAITGGFNNTASHGGPNLAGRRVRICYLEKAGPNSNVIVRLEVAA